MSNIYFLIIGIIFAAIGIICFAVHIRHRINCFMKVTAEVSSVQKKKSGYWRGKTFYQYFPVFTYEIQGKSYTVKCAYPVKNAKNYQKGERVVIRYNPKAPENIETGGNAFSYVFGIIFLVFGVALIVCYFI